MQGPHFNYLTNSYVEALGLKPWLHKRFQQVYADVEVAPGIKLLDVPMDAFDRVVAYNHALYAQAPDGLSWDRIRS